ncbi:glycosyltransferase [Photobacterium carnosum]|uniref:glycosyltransferase n=1 Tax=Photobacterium carnosum TaxID=2023717 RepID=UPI001E5E619C|nr:glycosyltransferase [Photobacterium carnosum]MCD9557574.1 glycosyltransferase [Photobacterium carnosum]
MKNKNIVVLQNSLKTTKIFRFSYISNLINDGYNVFIVAPVDCLESKKEFENIGVMILPVDKPVGLLSLLKYIIKSNYYVIYFRNKKAIFICHFLVTILPVIFTLLPFNKRCILSIEGLGSFFSSKQYTLKLLKFIFKNSQCKEIFCNSDEFKLLGNKNSIVNGGIGVDLLKFSKKSENIHTKNSYDLLYVGRLISDKGVNDAISIFRLLRKRGYQVRLVLVGEIYPSNPSSLSINDINRYKYEFGEDILFEGFCSNPECYYHSSDIFILPSIREGFPVCVMEANACGLPVVAYDVPGCRDAIVNDINGKLIKLKDIEGFSDAIQELLDISILNKY